ncbi:MAG TPA: helix-turn-helix transcriptional regulator [Streptosporangiaceae bacterium]|nr:helix-turn-helix transcriptional regulator [Streptosporangiaceae bacterium]
MKAEAQVLKGHLDMLLLATLDKGPQHGYAVREALREAGGTRLDVPTGTIYPALRRLEASGLVTGQWTDGGGRRRRCYQLTPAGRRKLAGDRAAWREFALMVTAIVEPPPCPAATR